MFKLPPVMLTDSYKSSHYKLYPPNCQQITAYGEFRQPFERDQVDTRILFYGIRYIIETHLARKWTLEDLRQSELFFRFHNSGKTQFPFPADLIRKFICEGGDGYFPVKIESLREGETVYPHVPVYQITACKEYAPLCTWLETLMTMIWYPVTVCTLSRRAKELIRSAFDQSVDPDHHWLIDSRLHDFGFRGCTSVEQSVIGGSAHLVNFEGSDTMSAAYYAQMHLNEGRPVATSIPATEHSIMTSWMTEREAIDCLIEEFGSGVFACVMDSYDYARALSEVLPSIATKKLSKGGLMVLRPDSGDPVETVLMALR
jgi:nicotinic acid phosphoribosyltransferase